MQIKTVLSDDVHYNPTTNMFEALVTLETDAGQFRYPCAVDGSIMTPPCGAMFKLTQQAKHRHAERQDLSALTPKMSVGHWAHSLSNRKAA